MHVAGLNFFLLVGNLALGGTCRDPNATSTGIEGWWGGLSANLTTLLQCQQEDFPAGLHWVRYRNPKNLTFPDEVSSNSWWKTPVLWSLVGVILYQKIHPPIPLQNKWSRILWNILENLCFLGDGTTYYHQHCGELEININLANFVPFAITGSKTPSSDSFVLCVLAHDTANYYWHSGICVHTQDWEWVYLHSQIRGISLPP